MRRIQKVAPKKLSPTISAKAEGVVEVTIAAVVIFIIVSHVCRAITMTGCRVHSTAIPRNKIAASASIGGEAVRHRASLVSGVSTNRPFPAQPLMTGSGSKRRTRIEQMLSAYHPIAAD